METDPLRPGDRIGGCRVVEKRGAGAMGVVYKAHHLGLDKIVAVKVLHASAGVDGTFVERFLREARAAAKMEHPNIVQVYNVGQERGLYFIIMQYVEGESLMEVVEREGRLALPRASRIVRSVALALTEAHAKKIVHRDIKTANILIGADGRVRVTDFGLARTVESATDLTMPGTIMGTPGFIAPEVLQGAAADYLADQYAVGVVYYCLLTGALPYRGKTPYEIFSKQLTEEPTPLLRLAPDAPPPIAEIVQTAMAKDPAKRFPSMAEFVRHLDRVWRELTGAAAGTASTAASAPARAASSGRSPADHWERVARRERRDRLVRNVLGWTAMTCAFLLAGVLAASGAEAAGRGAPGTPPALSMTAPFDPRDPQFLPRVAVGLLSAVAFVSAFVLNRRQLYVSLAPALAVFFWILALFAFYGGAFLAAAPFAHEAMVDRLARAGAAFLAALAAPFGEFVMGVTALVGAAAALARSRRAWAYAAAALLGGGGFAAVYRFASEGVLAHYGLSPPAGARWRILWNNFYAVLLAFFVIALAISVYGLGPARRGAAARATGALFFILAGAALYAFGALCAAPPVLGRHSWQEILSAPLVCWRGRHMIESGLAGGTLAAGVWGTAFLYMKPR